MNAIAKTPLRGLWALTALSLALVALCLIWAAFDTRTFQGIAVWIKPLKFNISFVVLFGTLAFVVARLSPPYGQGRTLTIVVHIMAAAMLFEALYITAQAAQGQGSHYNDGTPFHQAMYGLMGIGAVSLVIGVAVIGGLVWRDKAAAFTPLMREAIVVGFGLSFLLTMITAGTMSSLPGHFIGDPGPNGAVLPLLGWSASVGDLRAAHFVALHAMQGLPILALVVRGARQSHLWLRFAACLWAALTLGLYVQALAGQPFLRL